MTDTTEPASEFITHAEAIAAIQAAYGVRLCLNTIQSYVARGLLDAVKIGRTVLIRRNSVERYISNPPRPTLTSRLPKKDRLAAAQAAAQPQHAAPASSPASAPPAAAKRGRPPRTPRGWVRA